jgi:hypothetical protein
MSGESAECKGSPESSFASLLVVQILAAGVDALVNLKHRPGACRCGEIGHSNCTLLLLDSTYDNSEWPHGVHSLASNTAVVTVNMPARSQAAPMRTGPQ